MSRTILTLVYNPFDCNDLWGSTHLGHLRSTPHILFGIQRRRRLRKYSSGEGTELELGAGGGGGCHQFFSCMTRAPFAENIVLPIQYWSLCAMFFLHSPGKRREKSTGCLTFKTYQLNKLHRHFCWAGAKHWTKNVWCLLQLALTYYWN